jgi:hypothetical protein
MSYISDVAEMALNEFKNGEIRASGLSFRVRVVFRSGYCVEGDVDFQKTSAKLLVLVERSSEDGGVRVIHRIPLFSDEAVDLQTVEYSEFSSEEEVIKETLLRR